jgi:ubiquinone/menaquinone biosynthesis C-methylase UbiE
MRVLDLDRDMSDVIPTGTTLDSEFLFERMTNATIELARTGEGKRVLDVASGFGQDALQIAENGSYVIGCEPSLRMLAWARLKGEEAAKESGVKADWVQGWGDALPFATGSFDAAFCKGALDHFDCPGEAIGEMARVTALDGRVVLAIANFESLACRMARFMDDVREDWLGKPVRRGRRHYDVPADHFTRYELGLMKEQMGQHVEIEEIRGVSLLWGFPKWTANIGRLPKPVANRLLRFFDWIAQKIPALADVIILAGRPKLTTRNL